MEGSPLYAAERACNIDRDARCCVGCAYNSAPCEGNMAVRKKQGGLCTRAACPCTPSLLLLRGLGGRPCRSALQRDAPKHGGGGAESNQDGHSLQRRAAHGMGSWAGCASRDRDPQDITDTKGMCDG